MSAEVNEILSAVAGNSRGGVRRVRIYAHGHFPAHTHTHTHTGCIQVALRADRLDARSALGLMRS